MDEEEIIETLKEGGVGVLPTDTLYGLVGSATLPDTIDRIYELKQRNKNKPLIVLISSFEQLEIFGVVVSEKLLEQLKFYWPGAYSIILPIVDDQFEYLSRNTDSIAFRIPDKASLIDIINETGPLVAPSANVEGLPHAKTVEEARKYFGSDVDFYLDEGELDNKPSTILSCDGDECSVVRE